MSGDPTPWIAGGIGAFYLGIIALYLLMIGFAVLATVFWIVELVDVSRREFPDPNTKVIWIVVLIFSHGVGAIVYYFAGRQQGWLPGQAPQGWSAPPRGSQWPPPPGA